RKSRYAPSYTRWNTTCTTASDALTGIAPPGKPRGAFLCLRTTPARTKHDGYRCLALCRLPAGRRGARLNRLTRRRPPMRLSLICLLCSLALPATAQIYKYTDAQGNTVFSDQAPQGVASEQVTLPAVNTVQPPPMPTLEA